jgi:hypothetical protein
MLTQSARSTIPNDSRVRTATLSATSHDDDFLDITTLSKGINEFRVYRSTGLEHGTQGDPLEWKQLPSGSIYLPSERLLHDLPNDNKPRHPTSNPELLSPRNHRSASTVEEPIPEVGTSLSASRPPKLDNCNRVPPNTSLPASQSRVKEFENASDKESCQEVLHTAERLLLGHPGTTEGIPLNHQNKSPQSENEHRAQPGPLCLEPPKRGSREEQPYSFTNSTRTIEDGLVDRLHDHGSSESSTVETHSDVSADWSVFEDQQDAELPTELVPIQATLVEQLIAGYISDWRPSHGHVRSRAGEETTVSGRGRSQASRSSRKLAPSSKSLGKRRKEPQQDPDDSPSSDDDCKRRRLNGKAEASVGRLFACPYAKYDPTRYSERNEIEVNYRGCSSALLRSISRVKQHLYRVHEQPEHYCGRCGMEFDHQELWINHSRETPICELRDPPFKEKMTTEQKNAVRKRTPGKDPRKIWYEIFEILFPSARVPNSPYAEIGSPEAVQDFLVYFQERSPQMLSALILQNTLLLGTYEQSMLDAAVGMAVPRLVREFGINFHREPEDISQASNNISLATDASMTVSAIQEQANSTMQHTEAGLSRTDWTGTGSPTASLENQQPNEQFIEFPASHYHHTYAIDGGDYSQTPRASRFTGSNHWDDVLQSLISAPVSVWPHETWSQSPGQSLQRWADPPGA